MRSRRQLGALPLLAVALVSGCAPARDAPQGDSALQTQSPLRYRLAHSGSHWDVVGADRIVEDLLPRYPDFFRIVLDPSDSTEPDLRPVKRDLESPLLDRRNYDALNAIAVAYFELNYRAESDRGGDRYFADSFRAAKLLALPWRAYGDTREGRLRDAILDFFEDAATGEKLHARDTGARVGPIVESLGRKEADPGRQARIRGIVASVRSDAVVE